MRGASLLALSVCVFGCGGGCSGPTEESAHTERSARHQAGGEEQREERAPSEDEPPTVRVIGVVDAHARTVVPRIENRGSAETSVGPRLVVQRREGTEWEDVSANVDLRFDCRSEAPECATLAPGAVLMPPAWLGTLGDAQCICTRCANAPAGTYRFVAQSCGGDHRVEGEPFELPAG